MFVCVMMKMGMVERETRRHRYIPQIPQLRNRSHWAAAAPGHHAFFRCATFPRLLCFLRPSFRVAHHACDVTAITQQGQAIGSSPFRRHRGMLWLEVMRPMLENGFVDRSLEWEWVPLWVSLSRGREAAAAGQGWSVRGRRPSSSTGICPSSAPRVVEFDVPPHPAPRYCRGNDIYHRDS